MGMIQYRFLIGRLVRQWLLHAVVVWAALTIIDTLKFLLKVQDGMQSVYTDGTPVTLWSRFADHNFGAQLVWLPVMLATLLVELNYQFIFLSKKLKVFAVTSVLCGVGCMLIMQVPNMMTGNSIFSVRSFWSLTSTVVSISGVFALYAFLYAVIRDYFHTRIVNAERRLTHSQAELAALKAQINPHFFFNTLNNMYGTALAEKAERTAQFIERLSGLMRYVIHSSKNDAIPVAQEVRFVKEYLELQRIRIPEQPNIKVIEQVFHDGGPAQIAPLLLLPFIENAFQYGVSIDHDCSINLSLSVKVQHLNMLITNRIVPGHNRKKGEGTGIPNVKKQLELLYPGRHALKIETTGGQFLVELHINLSK
jgi:sensor histidine kinase YesM